MIEKIDRPEAPPSYRIGQAKETKEDQHQQQNPREDMEQEYKRRLEGKEWSKFGQRARTIKPLRVARERVLRCLFKAANLHSGIGLLQVDVHWKDGRVTRDALMLITRLEDFIKLKKLQPGHEVPDELWAKGPIVEMGIVQMHAEAASFPGREFEGSEAQTPRAPKQSLLIRMGVLSAETRRINWGLTLMYVFIATLLIFAAVVLIR
ncbi:MAG: hypothetical protein WC956_07885 [bacterium]